MPFATYSIKENSFDKMNSENRKKFQNFLNNINELNRKKRAILVNKKTNILNTIKEKLKEIDNPNAGNEKISKFVIEQAKKYGQSTEHKKLKNIYFNSNDNLLEKEFLIECLNCFNSSLKCSIENYDVNIDFEKNQINEDTEGKLYKFSKDIVYAKEFDNAYDFNEKFLQKLEIFIRASIESEKKTKGFKKRIDTINIFHKELSKYLVPNFKGDVSSQKFDFFENSIKNLRKNINYDYKYYENTKKIEGGSKILLNWWSNLPDEIRPKKFNIITDIPTQLLWEDRKNKIKISTLKLKETEKKIEDFLFEGMKSKPKVIFLNRDEISIKTSGNPPEYIRFWDWTHKKHFAFGKDLHLLIYSDFGVEFIDPSFKKITEDNFENIKIRKNNKFYLIDSDMDEDFEQINTLYKKFPNKCGI